MLLPSYLASNLASSTSCVSLSGSIPSFIMTGYRQTEKGLKLSGASRPGKKRGGEKIKVVKYFARFSTEFTGRLKKWSVASEQLLLISWPQE